MSNVIFVINGTLRYYENIEKYVLRCSTIGFKQKYGHKSLRRADINLRRQDIINHDIDYVK